MATSFSYGSRLVLRIKFKSFKSHAAKLEAHRRTRHMLSKWKRRRLYIATYSSNRWSVYEDMDFTTAYRSGVSNRMGAMHNVS